MRPAEKLAIIATVVGAIGGTVAVIVTVIVLSLSGSHPAEPLPALVRDMPTVVDQITPAFSERIKAKFPIGSDEHRLIPELKNENFVQRESRRAIFFQSSPVCRNEWRVSWSADEKGIITDISAQYAPICS
jgi:hypothetical protein